MTRMLGTWENWVKHRSSWGLSWFRVHLSETSTSTTTGSQQYMEEDKVMITLSPTTPKKLPGYGIWPTHNPRSYQE